MTLTVQIPDRNVPLTFKDDAPLTGPKDVPSAATAPLERVDA